MRHLCYHVSNDLQETVFDENQTDFKLSKTVKFKTMSLLKDFIQLQNLYPKDFKVKEPPKEFDINIKYSGKAYGGGQNQLRYDQFQYIKATGQHSYGFWDTTWFAIQYQDHFKEKHTGFAIDRKRDYIEMLEPDKTWVFTSYG